MTPAPEPTIVGQLVLPLVTSLLAAVQSSDGNLPEPILVESITDVDTNEAGELEIELTTASLGMTGSQQPQGALGGTAALVSAQRLARPRRHRRQTRAALLPLRT
jgi:hypothetical protein